MSKSRTLASELIYTALTILKENNDEMQGAELIKLVSKKTKLDDWATHVYEKSGYVRWQSLLHFFTIDCTKAGYLVKKKGVWYLTQKGKEALGKYNKKELLDEATRLYRKWVKENKKNLTKDNIDEDNEDIIISTTNEEKSLAFEKAEENSLKTFSDYIHSMDPYKFQDICSALLRGMGHYTPFIAPKGKDGGIDIIAYRDPLGALIPRIKIQVKHRQNTKATSKEVRELGGRLNSDDIGIFISTGGFTSDIKRENRVQNNHIELIDLERFIELWKEFYPKLSDEDKSFMPIVPIYFLNH